jgi:hypothetical protein
MEGNQANNATYSKDNPLSRIELLQREGPIMGKEYNQGVKDFATLSIGFHPADHRW